MFSVVRTPKPRRMAAHCARLLLIGLLVSILTSSHSVTVLNPKTVVFALDVSDSIPWTDRSLTYVADTAEHTLAKPDRLAVVAFGRDAAVEIPPVSKVHVQPIESRIDRKATNLEEALKLSSLLVSSEATGRIVLISDGVQTTGDASRMLPELKSRGIAVDVLPVEYTYSKEVWLDSLQLPVQDHAGRIDKATVQLSALTDGAGTLTIRDSGVVLAEQQVTYKPGANQFLISLPQASPGYHEYVANIEVDASQDSLQQNNTVYDKFFIGGDRKVLLVTNTISKPLDRSSLEFAISQAVPYSELIRPQDLPAAASSLASYESVIFCDVHRDLFETAQLKAVRDAVRDYGVGFLMTGGSGSFGPGGYHETVIEQILPVSLEVPDASGNRLAVAIVMDQLRFSEATTWSKRLLKQTLKVLRKNDECCVLVGSAGSESVLWPLSSTSTDEQRTELINGATIGPIQHLDRAMEMGLAELQDSAAGTHHMLIVAGPGYGKPPRSLIEKFVTAKVSLSIVATPGWSRSHDGWMPLAAEATGGKYYVVEDPNQLVDVIMRETGHLRRDVLSRRTFVPDAAGNSEIVRNLAEIPPLDGYVVTTVKPGTVNRVLDVPAEGVGRDPQRPLLATWRSGAGKAAALMANLNSPLARQWQKWDRLPQFVRQLLADLRRSEYLWMSTQISGDEALITFNDVHPDESRLVIDVKVTGPDDHVVQSTAHQIAPKTYQLSLPLWEAGRYRVAAMAHRGNVEEYYDMGFANGVTYSPEYLQFRSQPQVLQRIAAATGGQMLTGDARLDSVYARTPRTAKQIPEASFDWFLIALALLVPLNAIARSMWSEIAEAWTDSQRHIQISPSATIVNLLRTKQWVTAALSAKGTARMLVQIWSPAPVRTKTVTQAASTPDQTVIADQSSASTIEKLLLLKRQNHEQS